MSSDAPVEVARMLVLSTHHLRENTCNEWLRRCPWACFRKDHYGWFMYVPHRRPIYDDYGPVPGELLVIIDYAREHDFLWVMFDRDGPTQPGLVVYDW